MATLAAFPVIIQSDTLSERDSVPELPWLKSPYRALIRDAEHGSPSAARKVLEVFSARLYHNCQCIDAELKRYMNDCLTLLANPSCDQNANEALNLTGRTRDPDRDTEVAVRYAAIRPHTEGGQPTDEATYSVIAKEIDETHRTVKNIIARRRKMGLPVEGDTRSSQSPYRIVIQYAEYGSPLAAQRVLEEFAGELSACQCIDAGLRRYMIHSLDILGKPYSKRNADEVLNLAGETQNPDRDTKVVLRFAALRPETAGGMQTKEAAYYVIADELNISPETVKQAIKRHKKRSLDKIK